MRSATAFGSVTLASFHGAAIVRICLHGVIDTERRDRVHSGFADTRAPEAWVPLRLRPRPERLLAPLSSLQGVGPAITRRLAGLGLRTSRDALHYAPRRYEAAAPKRSIAGLLAGEEAAIAGTVRGVTRRQPRRRLSLVKARVADETGEITAVWFNQPWLLDRLVP